MNIKEISIAISFIAFFCCTVSAQDQQQASGKSESTIELSYYKNAMMFKTAVAVVKVRKDKKFVAAKNVRVNFYALEGSQPKQIKSAYTNNKGKAVIELPNDLPLDDELSFTVIARVEADPVCEDVSEKIHYKDAGFVLRLDKADTNHLVTAIVAETGKDGKPIPVKGAEVKFYVQRMFGIMPAAEENTVSTGENGEASLAFPKNIPGDIAGDITVMARMEDNEHFGNVESKASAGWGTSLVVEKDPFPRALWEPAAPLPLITIILTMFGGVWCAYFIIFFHLIKIKQDEHLVL